MAEVGPQKQPKGPLVLALLMIAVGVGWLMTAKGYNPSINWVWTLGLATIGVVTFIVSGGVDKLSVVFGPFFLGASGLSILRQTELLTTEVEMPLLVILVGVVLLVAQAPFIPQPSWYGLPPGENKRK